MPTLLIVDDALPLRQSLHLLFASHGFTTVLASDGAEALALAARHPIDAALVDVQMPGLHGVEVSRRLRAQAALLGKDLPVWQMTGSPSGPVARAALAAGVIAVLEKPLHGETLVAQVHSRLERTRGSLAEKPTPDALPSPIDSEPGTQARPQGSPFPNTSPSRASDSAARPQHHPDRHASDDC